MNVDPVEQLDSEWRRLTRGPLQERMLVWAAADPALAAFPDPASLLRFLHGPSRGQDKDEVLAALLVLARQEPLAGRVLLQALLPGLKALAGRLLLTGGERPLLWQLLLAQVWEQICCYPVERRPRRVAANLLLDTLNQTTRTLKRERQHWQLLPLEPLPAVASDAAASGDVERPLRDAVAAQALTAAEAELILATRIDGASLAFLAREAGLPYMALHARRYRAEKRLMLFLGKPAAKKRPRNRPSSTARADRDRLAGSAGGGAVHQP